MVSKVQLEQIFAEQREALAAMHRQSGQVMGEIADALEKCIRRGGKILFFGNGGSAADAQHVVAEIVGRFTRERKGYPAIALTTDTSIITAVANDFGFDSIFERQVEALANPGDIAVGISTSGNSPNVLRGLEKARELKTGTIGFTGGNGGEIPGLCDLSFVAPTPVTARIQELHIAAWHAICDLVEAELVDNPV
ncbi:MAG: D-sedoheptulose 7-phosphate isomerase [Calditrichaeota bacterium]|nr:D-sedoheptulose 7-phosphate isomerase [Calditrichota bacterium]MBT7616625.1 D-sedoheptulose 7-phosphate isomerase [Calditrichota bacterium]MBT7787980.1 D-sedoheptulose 7-phosphate isomerase [Calditrichota bacterium]